MEDKNAKLVIFSKGDDKFIEDIANKLSAYYEIKRITINMLHMEKLEEWMKWADICWFEWCDELLVYASRLDIAKEKKIICRLHSYEAFTNYPARVNWACVDSLIFVSETIRRYAINTFGIDEKITTVIPNGVDLAHFNFENRNQGFNIAYAGYINYKKGPMLLLQVFKALYDSDNRYKFYIAGQFQDPRYSLYFKQMVAEFGLEKNYYFEGWQKNLDKWLEDKNYILCTSVLESQNMSVMQAMAKGIKPVIHNFVGASEIYPNKYLWNTISEAVFTIRDNEYNSGEYRDFVVDNYSLDMQLKSTVSLLENISIKIKKQVNQNQKLRREFSEKEDNSTFEYIHDKMNEFISYETNDFDSFDFTTAKAIIGKRERFNRYELIEFILNNSQNKKLIINSIWYDLYNKEYILPEQIRNSKNSDEILLIASDIIKKDVVYKNNIAGFISDPEIKADVEQNYLAYMWERGIPASQFLPINVYLRIAERYTFAAGYMNKESRVLEAPCGFGYGAAYFSRICRSVEAIDIAEDNIRFANQAYRQSNIHWNRGDVTCLPYDTGEFDIYVSFEVFEHLPAEMTIKYVEEAYRVLKKSGKFIISTPNKAMRRNVHNPFHIKEYEFEEFSTILNKVFDSVEFYSVEKFKVEKGMKKTANNMIAVCEK